MSAKLLVIIQQQLGKDMKLGGYRQSGAGVWAGQWVMQAASCATIVLPDAWAVVERRKQEAATMPKLDRITADPTILGGKACIRGMRIAVSLVVNLVANGMSTAEIIAEYPDLEPEDIRQALQYAAWAADDAIFAPISAAA